MTEPSIALLPKRIKANGKSEEDQLMPGNDEEKRRGQLIVDSSTVISGVFVILLAGIGAMVWNTNSKMIELDTTLRFLAERVEARSDLSRTNYEAMRREQDLMQRNLNTIWPRLRAIEQRLKMPINKDEYEEN